MERRPHVLIFPYPIQGHIKAMLPLAQLICHAGLHVTFLNTEANHRRLTRIQNLSARFPTLHFASISDGMPADRSNDDLSGLEALAASLKSVTKPLFKQLLLSSLDSHDDSAVPNITCIIADGILSFTIDVAEELGVPFITYRTASAPCYLWANFCLSRLVELGHVPVKDENMDETVAGVAGLESLTRGRDLPSFCRRGAALSDIGTQFFINEAEKMRRASGLILNTFDDLDSTTLSLLAPLFQKIYTVGPLAAHMKTRIGQDPLSCLSNLWQEDRKCMEWLDSKPPGSVIYVSFGSLALLTHEQLLEFRHGLVNSGSPFLWVIRNGLIAGEEGIPTEIELVTKEIGLLVDWAPQEDVLAHPAVGGFLTHSGWNSTMEAIVAGVPMLCWPQIADQQINSRWVSEAWKIGIDMKDTCDRQTVELMVRDLMAGEKEHLNMQMQRISKLAMESVSPGGSSYNNIDKLIEDLRKM